MPKVVRQRTARASTTTVRPTISDAKTSLSSNTDLIIHLNASGARCQSFGVVRKTLQMASPVWNTMLDPDKPWRKSSSDEVTFEDDDPTALLILLNIAHLNFKSVSTNISLDLLVKIALLCDKYDATPLVQPYHDTWVQNLKPPALEGIDAHRWLLISWTFGMEHISANVCKKFATRARRHGGDIYFHGEALRDSPFIPAGAYETIYNVRSDILFTIHLLYLKYIKRFDKLPVCKTREAKCDAALYGSLMLGLQKCSDLRSDITAPDDMKGSINDLWRLIQELKFHEWPGHKACNLIAAMNAELREIRATILPKLQTRHKAFIGNQKSGKA